MAVPTTICSHQQTPAVRDCPTTHRNCPDCHTHPKHLVLFLHYLFIYYALSRVDDFGIPETQQLFSLKTR